jgi:predicted MFS family arabinose efflux permease
MTAQPGSGTTAVRVAPIVALVAALVGQRVLSVSALLPVLSPYGFTLTDSALLVGIAFGGYGLTMALMQIPMGTLSDRFGRRPLLLVGLLLFILGTFIAGTARSIEILILGRLIEGTGAISAVAMALATDVLPEERRTLGLAIAGIAAGGSFLLGVAIGPLLASLVGVPGIFLILSATGVLLLIVVLIIVPGGTPENAGPRVPVWTTLRDPRGISLDAGSFALYLSLTATLFALPLLWVGFEDTPGPLAEGTYRNLLMISVLLGGTTALGLARQADKRGIVQGVAVGSFVVLGLAAFGLLSLPIDPTPLLLIGVILAFYFAGHGALSAALPSLVGKHFTAGARGAAMGGLATSQYLGSFTGGMIGALLWTRSQVLAIVVLSITLVAAALIGMTSKTSNNPPIKK